MQCKDIPDLPILRYLESKHPAWVFLHGLGREWPSVQDAMPAIHHLPEADRFKLALAKMRMLFRRGLVSGCPCGCRGDFQITQSGRAMLAAAAQADLACLADAIFGDVTKTNPAPGVYTYTFVDAPGASIN